MRPNSIITFVSILKAIAAILCLYLFGLCIQPAVFPFHHGKAKTASCCKNKKSDHKSCSGDKDCCGDNPCNPFFSKCPVCAATAVSAKYYLFSFDRAVFFERAVYLSKDDHLVSKYQQEILHPPRFV